MRKFYAYFTLMALVATPLAYTDNPTSPTQVETPAEPVPTETTPPTQPAPAETTPAASIESNVPALDTTTTPEDEGTPVGYASKEGSSAARRKTWQNIGLAVAAVAVAVTALILVSSNSGHHK